MPLSLLLPLHQRRAATTAHTDMAELVHHFLDTVHAAQSRLSSLCTTVEEYVAKLGFYSLLTSQFSMLDSTRDLIHSMYQLLEQYSVRVPDMDRATYAGLDSAHSALRTTIEELEAGKEEADAKYGTSLESGVFSSTAYRLPNKPRPSKLRNSLHTGITLQTGVEEISKELLVLQSAIHAEMLLSEDASAVTVIDELEQLQIALASHIAELKRINGFQRYFHLPESRLEELDALDTNVRLKLALWHGRAEFASLQDRWLASPLDALQFTDMEECVGRSVW